jgi:hypothetical protein
MPSTLDIREQAPGDVDAACCPPEATNPLTRPPRPPRAEPAERRRPANLDSRDLELLAGAER